MATKTLQSSKYKAQKVITPFGEVQFSEDGLAEVSDAIAGAFDTCPYTQGLAPKVEKATTTPKKTPARKKKTESAD